MKIKVTASYVSGIGRTGKVKIVPDKLGKILVAAGKAREIKPQPAKPKPEKASGYQRRDMVAEGKTTSKPTGGTLKPAKKKSKKKAPKKPADGDKTGPAK